MLCLTRLLGKATPLPENQEDVSLLPGVTRPAPGVSAARIFLHWLSPPEPRTAVTDSQAGTVGTLRKAQAALAADTSLVLTLRQPEL